LSVCSALPVVSDMLRLSPPPPPPPPPLPLVFATDEGSLAGDGGGIDLTHDGAADDDADDDDDDDSAIAAVGAADGLLSVVVAVSIIVSAAAVGGRFPALSPPPPLSSPLSSPPTPAAEAPLLLPPLLWLTSLFDSPAEEGALAGVADSDSDADGDDLTVVACVPRTDLTVVGGAPLPAPLTPSPLVATFFCCFLLRNLVMSAPI
jgi:hypothetical protein